MASYCLQLQKKAGVLSDIWGGVRQWGSDRWMETKRLGRDLVNPNFYSELATTDTLKDIGVGTAKTLANAADRTFVGDALGYAGLSPRQLTDNLRYSTGAKSDVADEVAGAVAGLAADWAVAGAAAGAIKGTGALSRLGRSAVYTIPFTTGIARSKADARRARHETVLDQARAATEEAKSRAEDSAKQAYNLPWMPWAGAAGGALVGHTVADALGGNRYARILSAIAGGGGGYFLTKYLQDKYFKA